MYQLSKSINSIARYSRVLLITCMAGVASDALADTYIVRNTNDSGADSLRQAIEDSNDNAGTDEIHFAISGGVGPYTILLDQQLPIIKDTVIIDAYTQPSSSMATNSAPANIQVILDGSEIYYSAHGLFISEVDNSVVRGLSFVNFSGAAIRIDNSNKNKIQGNHIGLIASCLWYKKLPCSVGGNGYGVGIVNDFGTNSQGQAFTSNGNIIGGNTPEFRNVISYSDQNDIYLQKLTPEGQGNLKSNYVQGNYIGTNALGEYPTSNTIFNTGTGVSILNASRNIIGGSSDHGEGNLIAGKAQGIHISAFGSNMNPRANEIKGNDILFNNTGIWLKSIETVVGGEDADSNVIAGGDTGIFIFDDIGSMTDNQVIGNYIGGTREPTSRLTPPQNGIKVAADRTIIGGNDQGNYVSSYFSPVQVRLSNYSSGAAPYEQITISQNTLISRTYSPGIDLAEDGITDNDLKDKDSGPNTLLNYPVISSVASNFPASGGNIRLSHDDADNAYIEIFSNSTCNRNTERYVGGGYVAINSSNLKGQKIITKRQQITITEVIEPGEYIVTTATVDNNTSEVSDCYLVR